MGALYLTPPENQAIGFSLFYGCSHVAYYFGHLVLIINLLIYFTLLYINHAHTCTRACGLLFGYLVLMIAT